MTGSPPGATTATSASPTATSGPSPASTTTAASPSIGRSGATSRCPPQYVAADLELAYATTAYGAQGETVTAAHVVVGDQTGAASAYVAMTRGRARNTAHLVADTVDDARTQWIDVFAATAPTSAPPTPPDSPPTTSTATAPP